MTTQKQPFCLMYFDRSLGPEAGRHVFCLQRGTQWLGDGPDEEVPERLYELFFYTHSKTGEPMLMWTDCTSPDETSMGECPASSDEAWEKIDRLGELMREVANGHSA